MKEDELSIQLEGTPNFRDIGGLPAANGRRVRHHRVYRTEGPHFLTDRDIETLLAADIRLVCDLRSAAEIAIAPNAWCAGTDIGLLNLDVTEDLRNTRHTAWPEILRKGDPEDTRRAMLASYRAKPEAMAPHLKRWIDLMIDDEQLPTLIHCTGGKDRTGVAIAFLLAAIDVPRSAIEEDYLASDPHTGRRFLPAVLEAMRAVYDGAIDPAMIDPMLGVKAEYLDATFDAAGPFDTYLEDRIGLNAGRRDRLRALLLEDAD